MIETCYVGNVREEAVGLFKRNRSLRHPKMVVVDGFFEALYM
jgi:hypothetical protein